MIIQFWLGAILLLIIASAVFLIPFLATKKRQQKSDNNRNELNRALYDVRINELEQDDNQGLIIDKEKIVSELQHNLLDDISDEELAETRTKNRWIWLPGLVILVFGSMTMYWSVGAYQEVDQWEQTLQRYPSLQDKLFNDQNTRPTEQDLRDIMLGLRTHLAKDLNDADGWLLYSRLGMVFKDTELALEAIKKAYELKPKSVDIRLVYAQLKMQKGDEYSQQQAELMLERLLIDEPTELQAWSMYAFIALEREDYTAAISRWKQMLTLTDLSSEQAVMLKDSINYAEQQLAGQGPEISNNAIAKDTERANVQSNSKTDNNGLPVYSINISAADNVTVPDAGFLIVYAQPVSGPKMPIAAVKLALTTLPINTTLSDANAMMEGMLLSAHSEFIIKVRLSQSGDVMKSSGDWQGTSGVIEAGHAEAINIIISEQL